MAEDVVVQGVLCQECTCPFDDDDWPDAAKLVSGHPRYCRACGGNPECNGATKIKKGKK